MRALARIAALALALGIVAGCGSLTSGDDGDDDDSPDAGSSGDAQNGCDVGVSYNPLMPIDGDTITATAFVTTAQGFLTYEWSVEDEGNQPVAWQPDALDGSQIRFTPSGPGPVSVRLTAVGSDCNPYDDGVNVRALGATDTPWRVRFTAPTGLGAPPQERSVVVPSGASYSWGVTPLDPGVQIFGSLTDGAGPVAGYIRLTPTGTPDLAIDGFAGADGSFTVRTLFGNHELLVVPFDAALAPRRLRGWTPVSGPITIDAGSAVTGTVRTPADAPLAGAIVSLRVDGLTSSVATTDGSGSFTVRARPGPGLVTEITVVPPAASGLPRLVSSPQVFDLAQPLAVRYAPALAVRDVGGAQARLGGAVAAGATVTFVGAIADAGSVSQGLSAATAAGSYAITVAADGTGALAAQLVPAAPAQAIVDGAAGQGLAAADLTATVPAVLDGAAPLLDSGRVLDDAGAAIANADIRAVPRGALAAAGAAEVHVVGAADGSFALPLAGDGAYELIVVDRAGDHALGRVPFVATGAGVEDVVLRDGLRLSGRVTFNGSAIPAVAVTVFCGDCVEPDRARPAALAGTGGAGTYRATLVDPGVAP